MAERDSDPDVERAPAAVNPKYAAFQIAKALTISRDHADPATRDRAITKIEKWESVLRNVLSGSVEYGSRTPLCDVPAWATLEVVTGGFATGDLHAGGSLQAHEEDLIREFPRTESGNERRVLNGYFLSDAGLTELQQRLHTGSYDIDVPEEGALLVVAWLVENGDANEARELLAELAPYFDRLRFYPVPLQQPRRFGSQVYLQDVGTTTDNINRIKPNRQVLAQKEAVEVWAPFYDRLIALLLETIEDGRPRQIFPDDWSQRAIALLEVYQELRRHHRLCSKPERANGHFAQIRAFVEQAVREPAGLSVRAVDQIRLITQRYIAKRGEPGSERCSLTRLRQRGDVNGPTYFEISKVVLARLNVHPPKDGLDDVGPIQRPIAADESDAFGLPEGVEVPDSIRRKAERCLKQTVSELIQRGLITSGETLARVLPQMTSGLRAAGIADASLRRLYAAIYRAFRRRRSLLLLNLDKQVQIEELPWVAAINRFHREDISSRDAAAQTLEEIALLTIVSFPHAILPNKLLQEMRALIKGAQLNLPLVDEIAADIFMGEFSNKFVESMQQAADLLSGSLYATYYAIDYNAVRDLCLSRTDQRKRRFGRPKPANGFAKLCAARADVSLGTWDPATNGMIIEQQQILTTQNLASLFTVLNLAESLRGELANLAMRCFEWICRRQQMKMTQWHARLVMLKNTAYAWRQMIFFLSLLSESEVADFLDRASEHLSGQTNEFADRFRPALDGLILAANGQPADNVNQRRGNANVPRFLGWTNDRHWLMPPT